ncbi:MAG: response regulator [Candidatus Paceibacterota bacterium]|jgi:DNA-binding response OmpR family regulator
MTADVKKIIFVEDEKALVDMYRGIFEKEGFVFITTSDINKALALTESEKPDAVLLDIIIPMPENTVAEQGYDYLMAVKNNNKIKDIPVIVFTNLDTPQDRKKCKEMGAAAYIFKRDCTPKEVTDTVLEVIRRSRG